MTREEIYKSGMLEDYALGLLSDDNRIKVEEWMSSDKAIKEEVVMLQETLQGYAQLNAVSPPVSLKESIMSEIGSGGSSTSANGDQVASSASSGSKNLLLFVLGAIAILAIYFSYHFYNSIAQLEEQLVACENEAESMRDKAREIGTEYAFLTDQQTRKTLLTGTALEPSAVAQVFWNPNTSKAVIDLSALPPCPEGKTYQLWADVEGEMINMGVLPKDAPNLVEVNFIPSPESFNITIEPEGGSDHPTVEFLLANGAT